MDKCSSCDRVRDRRGAHGLCHRCYERARHAGERAANNARRRALYAADPARREARLAYGRQWREANKAKVAASNRNYAAVRKSQLAVYQRAYRAKNALRLKHTFIARKFGLTPEQFEAMIAAQNGLCAICQQPESARNKRFLSIDHCHATGAVRGLLCTRCNQALGSFKDDPALLTAAITYLKGFTLRPHPRAQGESPAGDAP